MRDDAVRDRFRGSLLGTAVGDALGMPVEGMNREAIRTVFGHVRDMLDLRLGRGTYTDDTQLMIGLAEALLDVPGTLDLDRVAARFGENFEPDRGYGGNARAILSDIRRGTPWREAVDAHLLPGGSYANGAAMRVAPVALAFFPDVRRVREAAARQSEVTGHTHPLGSFGAELQALAVLNGIERGARGEPFGAEAFVRQLLEDAPAEFEKALEWIAGHLSENPEDAARRLGTSGAAVRSVPAALWAFLSHEKDPEEAIARAVNMGGDADSIGAMTGAIAGAYHGAGALPARWLDALENGPNGRDYILELADRLFETHADEIEPD